MFVLMETVTAEDLKELYQHSPSADRLPKSASSVSLLINVDDSKRDEVLSLIFANAS